MLVTLPNIVILAKFCDASNYCDVRIYVWHLNYFDDHNNCDCFIAIYVLYMLAIIGTVASTEN